MKRPTLIALLAALMVMAMTLGASAALAGNMTKETTKIADTFEDTIPVRLRDAGTIVFHDELHSPFDNSSNKPHFPPTIFTGVVQQVPQQLHQVAFIARKICL